MHQPDPAKAVPILVAHDWRGADVCLCQPLADGEGDAPLIAYGEDTPQATMYLTEQQCEEDGLTLEALHEQAVGTLAARREAPDFEQMESLISGGLPPYVMSSGDDLTASDLLDPATMRRYQEWLEVDEILVGVPNRQLLFAGVAAGKEDLLAFVIDWFAKSDGRSEPPGISPWLFRVRDGAIVGVHVTTAEELEEHWPEGVPTEEDEDGPQAMLMRVETEDGAMAMAPVFAMDAEQLVNIAGETMAGYSEALCEDPDFNGQILFHVFEEPFAEIEGAEELLAELTQLFTAQAAEYGLVTAQGAPFQVGFVFGSADDFEIDEGQE